MNKNFRVIVNTLCVFCLTIASIVVVSASDCWADHKDSLHHVCGEIVYTGPTSEYCQRAEAYNCTVTCEFCDLRITIDNHLITTHYHNFQNISNNPTGIQIYQCTRPSCGFIKYE